MLNELFAFPTVMIDEDNEGRKMEQKLKDKELMGDTEESVEEDEYDMIYGEAEYPYWDFIGIEDRWLPSADSFNKALKGKFEACVVRFSHVGQLLVPWTKKKFKAELAKFAEEYEQAHPSEKKTTELRIMTLTPEQFEKATEDGKELS